MMTVGFWMHILGESLHTPNGSEMKLRDHLIAAVRMRYDGAKYLTSPTGRQGPDDGKYT